MLSSEGGKPKSNQPAPSRVNRFEDAFAGDVADSGEARSPSGKTAKAIARVDQEGRQCRR